MYLNFGDIGANIKTLVEEYQEKSKSHAKIESISDMKVSVEHTHTHTHTTSSHCTVYPGFMPHRTGYCTIASYAHSTVYLYLEGTNFHTYFSKTGSVRSLFGFRSYMT